VHSIRRFIVCYLAAGFLSGCYLNTRLPTFDDPVSFEITIHEDGWCEGTFLSQRLGVKHTAKFYDWRHKPKVHSISCSNKVRGWPRNARTILLDIYASSDDTPLPIDLSLDTARRDTHLVTSEDKIASVGLSIAGKGSLDSAFCNVMLVEKNWVLKFNTGADRKHHVLTGSGTRLCTW